MFSKRDHIVASDPLRRRLRRLSAAERREEAVAFLDLFQRENPGSDMRARKHGVLRDLARTGIYRHTAEELAFGARVAWRNHARCIGRRFWKSLEVVDCRSLTDPDDVAGRVLDHLEECQRDGAIKPMISIFAPVEGNSLPAWIESRQIVQYAGYGDALGGVLGDPANQETTRTAIALGWQPPRDRGPFDILPLIVRDCRGRRLLYDVPRACVKEISIRHPKYTALDELGLKWYAAPIVSDMILTIGGVDYPCAPFNGFYMGTEIGSRNLVDLTRYNLLPKLGRAVGVDHRDPLWKDRVLLELNAAVLHSFADAGVTIVDHHTASEQYLEFVHAEHAAGRAPSGAWDWIVPPQASSACPVFHMGMEDHADLPNYYRSRATDGRLLAISRATERLGRARNRFYRARRRLRDWRRAQA